MKLRFCFNGCLRRSLVPSAGAETVELGDWAFLSVVDGLETAVNVVRLMSLSWKQPSKAMV